MPGRFLVDLTPLRESRDFRLLFTGQLVSMLGSQLVVVAIPYQVYSMTHSSLQVGAISLAQLLPLVVGSLAGGPVGDSVDRRKIMLVTTAAAALTSVLMAGNALAPHPSLPALYVISAMAAGLVGFGNTARGASVPTLVDRRHLAAAFAFMQIIFQVGTVVGPAVSGQLLRVGLPLVYSLDAASFVVALVLTALMAPIPPVPGSRRPGLGSVWEGVRFLRRRQALQGVYLIDINAMVFGMPRALFPAMAISVFHGGPGILGLLYAAVGVGGLVGAVATGWVGRVRRQGVAITVAVMAWGAAITAFGFTHRVWVALVLLAAAGWADVISAVLRNTLLQTSIPDRFRSRLSSFQMAVVQGGPRLGDMESGTVASLVGIEFAVVSGGLACIAGAVLLTALLPGFRRHRAHQVEPGLGAQPGEGDEGGPADR